MSEIIITQESLASMAERFADASNPVYGNVKDWHEFIHHKYFDSPNIKYENWKPSGDYQLNDFFITDYMLRYIECSPVFYPAPGKTTILDIGAGISFQSFMGALIGNNDILITAVEPDERRMSATKELFDLAGLSYTLTCHTETVESFFAGLLPTLDQRYKIVTMNGSFQLMENQVQLLRDIRRKINPRYLVLDVSLHTVDTDIFVKPASNMHTKFETFNTEQDRLMFIPGRTALENMLQATGWNVYRYFDYKNYVGNPIGVKSVDEGYRMFYVLE